VLCPVTAWQWPDTARPTSHSPWGGAWVPPVFRWPLASRRVDGLQPKRREARGASGRRRHRGYRICLTGRDRGWRQQRRIARVVLCSSQGRIEFASRTSYALLRVTWASRMVACRRPCFGNSRASWSTAAVGWLSVLLIRAGCASCCLMSAGVTSTAWRSASRKCSSAWLRVRPTKWSRWSSGSRARRLRRSSSTSTASSGPLAHGGRRTRSHRGVV